MFSCTTHNTFSVQILYKDFSVKLNCSYINYTEAAATCSAAHQQSTFTLQILHKLYSLQLKCTYSNYTEASAKCSAAQSTAHLLYKYCTNCAAFKWTVLTYSMVQSPSWEANWYTASQEIPRISRNPKVHYRTHKRPPPVSILGQPNPVHIHTSHFLEIHPNIIRPSKPTSPQ